ncbi:MAG: hypothetical protein WD651_02255 [Acidimicrobiia bacterium]
MASPNLSFLDPRERIFSRLWGVALVAHVAGNWAQPDIPKPVGWANLAVGLVGVFLALRPGRRLLLAASVLVVTSVILEMPVTGNHWLLAGLVSAAILVTGGQPSTLFPAARMILLIFYAFAAFAKLNTGFFDPTVSCAVFYSNQWLDGFGLGPLTTDSAGATMAVWGSVLVESAVPILLVVRPLRPWGVVLGTVFHTVISFDLNQHFYDFTSVLLPLFFLFAPAGMVQQVERSWAHVPPRARRLVMAGFLTLGGAIVVSAVLPLTSFTAALVTAVPFFLWIPFGIWFVVVLVRALAPGEKLNWSMRPLAALVVTITFLNGLAPYTELKTAHSFNMYANLLTAGGESNHLLVTRTMPLREGYTDPVEILDSSDQGLLAYRDAGYLIAYPQFRQYLVRRPEVSVDYLRGGVSYSVPRVGERGSLAAPVPWWWRYFPLRAVDTQRPPRCQDVFLNAL